MEKVVSIRGAVSVKENSVKEIKAEIVHLFEQLFKQNKLKEEKIINIIFTVTDDIDVINPATIVRQEFKLNDTPMICLQEMKVKNGLPKCIRVMLQVHSESSKANVKHVYLGTAVNLRPDLDAKSTQFIEQFY